MLSPADLELRRGCVTSTDIARIVGASPWGNACDVFAEKVAPTAFKPSLAFRLGHFAEPMICDLIGEHFGVSLDQTPTLRHPSLSWVAATPDRLVVDDDGIAEAKYVGLRAAHEWEDEATPPDHVVIQVTWHMIATVRRVGYAGALIGTEFKPYRIDYDEELAGTLLEEGARFHRDHMVTGRPPKPDGSEGAARMVRAIVGKPRAPVTAATPAAEEAARLYFEREREKKAAEQRLEEARELLLLECGEAEGMKGDGWRLYTRWREESVVPAYTRKGYRAFDLRKASGRR